MERVLFYNNDQVTSLGNIRITGSTRKSLAGSEVDPHLRDSRLNGTRPWEAPWNRSQVVQVAADGSVARPLSVEVHSVA